LKARHRRFDARAVREARGSVRRQFQGRNQLQHPRPIQDRVGIPRRIIELLDQWGRGPRLRAGDSRDLHFVVRARIDPQRRRHPGEERRQVVSRHCLFRPVFNRLLSRKAGPHLVGVIALPSVRLSARETQSVDFFQIS